MSEAFSDPEDTINDALERRMEARKMLTNARYFAFTATPKNKTLEMFGEAYSGEKRESETSSLSQLYDETDNSRVFHS